MKIVSLVPEYTKLRAGRVSESEYFTSSPEVFEQYFIYWSGARRIDITISEDEIIRRAKLMTECIHKAAARFQQLEFDLTAVEAILLVGGNGANGHAFMRDGKAIAWFALETFATLSQMRIFAAHEISHAIHYAATSSSYFHDRSEQLLFSRRLITEGLATYLSTIVCQASDKEALWADTLDSDSLQQWMRDCKEAVKQLSSYALEHYDSRDPSINFFSAADPDLIYKNRAGYYLGLQVIREYAANNSISPWELLHLPMDKFTEAVRAILFRIIVEP
jgi:uncharacterized protein YjaZ